MKYLSICNSKKSIPVILRAEDMKEWASISKDTLLHKKCSMIKCYELMPGSPQKLIIMIDTNEPDALNLLARDLGKDWSLETFSLHEVQEILEDDHTIIAG